MGNQEIAVQAKESSMLPVSVDEVIQSVQAVEEIVDRAMTEGVHWGIQEGTKKKTLKQPGAEVLCIAFRLVPDIQSESIPLENGHREYMATCTLRHIETGATLAVSHGSCSTMESKYRYRFAERSCPDCNAETIRKGREGGWYCWRKIGGCGALYDDGDRSIEGQTPGRVDNPDPADAYNTVLKMAEKRALLGCVRMRTGVSAKFVDFDDESSPSQPAAAEKPLKEKPKEKSPEETRRAFVYALLKENKVSTQDLKAQFNLASINDIQEKDMDQVSKWVRETGKAMAEVMS